MEIFVYLAGMLLMYAAFKAMAEAGQKLPAEHFERLRHGKWASPWMVGLSAVPFVAAYFIYQQYPRYAWKIIFWVLVLAAIEFAVWYVATLRQLKRGGYPAEYVSSMRHAYSLFGLGVAVLVGVQVWRLFG